ncbi:MAG: hypothetical protein JRI36_01015 [Deltaproteobacteria bacterium]|nr:hypothetical protein [Deltaproteobacteria bacterium]
MKKGMLATMVLSMLVFAISPHLARAEVVDQIFTLHPGWNAVFLEVEPTSTKPEDVFSSFTFDPPGAIADLISVWRWNPRSSTVEFIQDPGTLVPDQPQWMVYYPGQPLLTNLHAINGETAYLIHQGGSSNVTWTVTGEPTIPHIDWKANSFNFVGFHLFAGQEPFFVDFFSTSPAHAGQDIYVLQADSWVKVTSPTDQMKDGEGFWIYCKGSSEFTGPVSVQLEQGTGLHFGKVLVEQEIRVFNHSATDKMIHLNVDSLTSSPPVYLYYWLFDSANNVASWVEFPISPDNLYLNIASGEMQRLRLGVRRANLTPGVSYGGNVYILDNDVTNWIRIPITVTGINYTGLWVGDATIRKVSQPSNTADPDTPAPTGSEFSFRLILHVDSGGQARLLREVVQMWQEGTWKPDPNNLGKFIVDEPGHFVLLGNDALIPFYSGAALRDGQPMGRRISSSAFGFRSPQAMTGNFQMGSSLSLTVVLPADDPRNPFFHKYHPDHKVASQSYEVTRDITLEFTDQDSQGNPIAGISALSWGSSEIGGIYKETLWGLHRHQIYIEGTFLLRKASDDDELLF